MCRLLGRTLQPLGAPALYARRHFDALCRLRGDRGGKALLEAHRETVVRVPFAPAAVDVDTPEDYRRLQLTRPPPPRRARARG